MVSNVARTPAGIIVARLIFSLLTHTGILNYH